MDRSYSSVRHHQSRHRRDNPSFSSSLLDSIYRSIDGEEDEATAERELIYYRETLRNKNNTNSGDDFRRASMIETWMEKKSAEKFSSSVRRSSDARSGDRRAINLLNSNSTSSESSSGGVFSSSESDRPHRRPKPIRTSFSAPPPEINHAPPTKRESGFVKTKSRALKIYGDLKKVKQPISPGGKLASFLNSLFNNNNNGRNSNSKPNKPINNKPSSSATACSSASSFSRSCLSNTPSSRGPNNNNNSKFGEKRSVRFCLVEDKNNNNDDLRETSLMAVFDDRRRVQEVAIDLLKSYQRKSDALNPVSEDFRYRKSEAKMFEDDEDIDDDDDDDVASYSSSDLFELDSLSAVGIDQRYREELPVYETTHFDTNRAIANGFIL